MTDTDEYRVARIHATDIAPGDVIRRYRSAARGVADKQQWRSPVVSVKQAALGPNHRTYLTCTLADGERADFHVAATVWIRIPRPTKFVPPQDEPTIDTRYVNDTCEHGTALIETAPSVTKGAAPLRTYADGCQSYGPYLATGGIVKSSLIVGEDDCGHEVVIPATDEGVARALVARDLPTTQHAAQRLGETMDDWQRLARLGGARIGDVITGSAINRGRLIEALQREGVSS